MATNKTIAPRVEYKVDDSNLPLYTRSFGGITLRHSLIYRQKSGPSESPTSSNHSASSNHSSSSEAENSSSDDSDVVSDLDSDLDSDCSYEDWTSPQEHTKDMTKEQCV
jgi:hypothetical protein